MKTVYEAANGLEAHMIQGLLMQARIESFVDGYYLAGGIGELPTSGLVRVQVHDDDWTLARETVQQWEATSGSTEAHAADGRHGPAPGSGAGLLAVYLTGLVSGILLMLLWQ